MNRDALVARMTELLVDAVEAEEEGHDMNVSATSALIGGEAVLSSISLVSFIMDIEAELEDEHEIQVLLVNESALSRKQSPFRTVETLADYVLELVGETPVATA